MDGGVGLILLSGVMLLGSFIAGSIPIVMQLSEEKVHFVSVVGAGLLVGTALAVIIPEGIHTLYIAAQHSSSRSHGSNLPNPMEVVLNGASQVSAGVSPSPLIPEQHGHNHDNHSSGDGSDAFSSVGLALVLGFIFMLLVDQCSRSSSSRGVGDLESLASTSSHSNNKRSFTATLGLVVHAAADGIALGAAATTSHTDVEMIVFFAIMLHKAPAAFGLVTFLLQQGLERKRIRRHLALFSFAAPATAILTYICISPDSGGSGGDGGRTMHATAMAMLFSAGTFLYVATVHVLPEVTKDSGHGYSRKELLGLVLGALLPLLLTAGHHH